MMNVYLRADDQPGDERAGDAGGSGPPPGKWWRWKRPGTLLTGVASAALVWFYLTPAGQSPVTAAGHLFAGPGCAHSQSLVQVPPSAVLATSRGARDFEWTFPRSYDIQLVCLAGDPAGPGGSRAGGRPAVTATLTGQCPERTASLQGHLGSRDAYQWMGAPFDCVTDNVVLHIGAAPARPARGSPGHVPPARFYYCPDGGWAATAPPEAGRPRPGDRLRPAGGRWPRRARRPGPA